MAIKLEVRYYRQEQETHYYAYGLRVLVNNATDMSKEVFLFQRGAAPAPGSGEDPSDQFICIADPVDLQEIPIGVPNLPEEIPYYRIAEVTLWYRSVGELEEAQALIAADLQLLVDSMKALDTLDVMTEVDYE